jgi:diguanylate cyclase (GGDEF)-like protein
MKRLKILSYIALPILNIHGKVLGILFLDNEKYQTFTKERIRFFEVISKHIGLMLSNAVYLEELFVKSRYDGLTGLYNRETFELLYTKLYDSCRYEDKKFSILMLDIDDFKEINDQFGHQVGDSILREVADSIMNSVRKEDIVARYGGEEIIIALKDSDEEEAKVIAERIRGAVECIEVKNSKVTVSIGISTFRKDSHDKTKLISIADSCLYEAKRAGKNYVKTLN